MGEAGWYYGVLLEVEIDNRTSAHPEVSRLSQEGYMYLPFQSCWLLVT